MCSSLRRYGGCWVVCKSASYLGKMDREACTSLFRTNNLFFVGRKTRLGCNPEDLELSTLYYVVGRLQITKEVVHYEKEMPKITLNFDDLIRAILIYRCLQN